MVKPIDLNICVGSDLQISNIRTDDFQPAARPAQKQAGQPCDRSRKKSKERGATHGA